MAVIIAEGDSYALPGTPEKFWPQHLPAGVEPWRGVTAADVSTSPW